MNWASPTGVVAPAVQGIAPRRETRRIARAAAGRSPELSAAGLRKFFVVKSLFPMFY